MRKSLFILLLLDFFAHNAHGYCNRLPRLICAEYANSRVVVIAKLVSVNHYSPPDTQDWRIYTMRTDKILRGSIENDFRVYEENSSGRAPFYWVTGESYLLFLDARDDGTWWLYGCGNSTPVKGARLVLEAIESMKTRKGGFIQGIVGRTGEAVNLKGARVTIQSNAKTYTATANRQGKFGLHVPAGHYVIQVSLAGWSFAKDPLDTYEDPADITIEDGACAELSFTAERKL